MADSIRRKRLGGTIRRHLSAEISREVADPRLAALSVQEVEMTGDLSIAKVSVRLMFGGQEPGAREEAMAALLRVAPGLRSSLSPVLRMRHVPELRFSYDEGDDHRARIDDVLNEIKREDDERRRELGLENEDE
jgi:ribosome-binding factor A